MNTFPPPPALPLPYRGLPDQMEWHPEAAHGECHTLRGLSPSPVTLPTSCPSTRRPSARRMPLALKHLTKKLLNWDIPVGKRGHSSEEDARATMEL